MTINAMSTASAQSITSYSTMPYFGAQESSYDLRESSFSVMGV
jgi:hypothetical protein